MDSVKQCQTHLKPYSDAEFTPGTVPGAEIRFKRLTMTKTLKMEQNTVLFGKSVIYIS